MNWFLLLFLATVVYSEEIPKYDVVIIGAGAAGIAAATKLLENGIKNIIILEAENRYGGRIYNEYEGDYYKAFGAEWIPADENNIGYQLVKQANAINHQWTPKPGILVTSDGSELTYEALTSYKQIIDESKNELEGSNETLNEFYKRKFDEIPSNKFDEGLARNIGKFFNGSVQGNDWDKETGLTIAANDIFSGDPVQPIRGMKTILDILMKIYPSEVLSDDWKNIIKLNKLVTKIHWNLFHPLVQYKDLNTDEIFNTTANFVINTIPLGVLKADKSLFDPELPYSKRNAIDSFEINTENNMYLTFKERWWPEKHDLFIIWTKSDVEKLSQADKWLSKIEGFIPVDNSSVLAVHNMELDYSSSEGLSDSELSDKLMSLLRKAFHSKGWNILDPFKVEHSRWHSNPHFRGSFAFRGIKTIEAGVTHADLRIPLKNNEDQVTVYFAGEATNDESGTVDAAIRTGYLASDEIIKHFNKLIQEN